jgi:putative transposase
MANTFHQLYVQTVFPVKYRKALIHSSWKPKLQAIIGNLINETGCKTFIVNGMDDHMHCFFGLKPSLSVSDVMKSVKAKSSKWINENGYLRRRFEWQPGYGSFSYSRNDVNKVYHYIRSQAKHHRAMSFREEYIRMLREAGVTDEVPYLFDELK